MVLLNLSLGFFCAAYSNTCILSCLNILGSDNRQCAFVLCVVHSQAAHQGLELTDRSITPDNLIEIVYNNLPLKDVLRNRQLCLGTLTFLNHVGSKDSIGQIWVRCHHFVVKLSSSLGVGHQRLGHVVADLVHHDVVKLVCRDRPIVENVKLHCAVLHLKVQSLRANVPSNSGNRLLTLVDNHPGISNNWDPVSHEIQELSVTINH